MDTKRSLYQQLENLNLSRDETIIYLELLQNQSTHANLSHITGINRTKVYRIIEILEKRSLVLRRTDDTGVFLVASDPSTLEIQLIDNEQKMQEQRETFIQLLPMLKALQSQSNNAFAVNAYEGIEGLKQMCWHELKTMGELLSMGGQTIEDLIDSHHWAEKHRELTVEAGYHIREIINPEIDLPTFTQNKKFMENYHYRKLPKKIAYFNEQTIIYNNVVATYHWRENKKVGVEIVSKSYADMMRGVFDFYWKCSEASQSLTPSKNTL
jgi:sugar-specific transcriptional regulator TrmB